jgi:predicted SAM-dependent methyltransferase
MKTSNICHCCNSTNISKSPGILMPFMAKMIFDYDVYDLNHEWNLYGFENSKIYFPCKTVQCQMCGFLFSDIRFDDEELENLYCFYREKKYLETREFFEPGYLIKNNYIPENMNNVSEVENFLDFVEVKTNILDWGGDQGKNTPYRHTSENIFIYDLSDKELSERCKKLNYSELKDNDYNIIVCSHVLEHVSYPQNLLNDIKNFMNDDTVLYIEIPCEKLVFNNPDSFQLHNDKKHWHEHINFFTYLSLHKLFESCGLSIVKENILNNEESLNCVNFSNIFMFACKKTKDIK